MRDKVVVVFGPTGTAGSGAVKACLEDPRVAEVRAMTRRPLGLSHDRLEEVACTDFADLSPVAEQLRAVDVCLFCLGTSARNVRGEDPYREIHVTYPLVAARALIEHSPRHAFVYLSGAGTNRRSRMMWARVKAEAEDRLGELGLARHINVRPGFIHPLAPSGLSGLALGALSKLAPSMGISAYDLGRAMLRLALDADAADSGATLENRDLRQVVGL